ncbi:MAG: Rrf2 family transcriptional regulator [Alphaproteobacteria bacterium]|nr:MAG: Rrf2 family transcriptional regulator [Alphaproteobacteria bacterium]
MKLSEGVEWAIHVCSLLAALPPGKALSARRLAEYFALSVSYLAKVLQQLSAAGLVASRRGPGGGYGLARSPDEITLREIVEAIEGTSPCFRCTEIRRRGPTAVADDLFARPCVIARTMWRAEEAWRAELAKVPLREIQMKGLAEMPAPQVEKAAQWLRAALR